MSYRSSKCVQTAFIRLWLNTSNTSNDCVYFVVLSSLQTKIFLMKPSIYFLPGLVIFVFLVYTLITLLSQFFTITRLNSIVISVSYVLFNIFLHLGCSGPVTSLIYNNYVFLLLILLKSTDFTNYHVK